MQQAAGNGVPARPGNGDASYRSIVSDLESLIRHIQTSIDLIKTATAEETPCGNEEIAGNVVVLDDVTPGCLRAKAALDACNAGLGIALFVLRETRIPRSDAAAGHATQPIRLIARA